MVFLGPLFTEEHEKGILKWSHSGVSNAANSFQWNVIRGLNENLDKGVSIINILPVGTWPRHFKLLKLPDREWSYDGALCHEVGCINLPFIKQITRGFKIKRLLKNCKDSEEIILCTAYLPFLNAVYRLPRNIKVTAIITDLPEYYDMHRVSALRKLLRKLNNKIVYSRLERVDHFVLLTEQMKDPLCVGERPYTVMEGICDTKVKDVEQKADNGKISLLYTGRLNYRYGLKTLLNVFEKIDDKNLELWICGSGEMESEIKELAKKDSRICFLGYLPHDEVLTLQQQASILINPRTNEGEYTKYSFPSKTMEYMASGTPIIMYKLDGIPDEYDRYLFYVPDTTEDALKQTIEKVCSMEPEQRKSIAMGAQRFVLDNKNRVIQAKRILDMINKK